MQCEWVDVRFERVEFWLKLSHNYVWKSGQLKLKHCNIRMIQWQKDFKPSVMNCKLEETFVSHKTWATKHGGKSQPGPDPENTKMWQFVSDE